MSIVSLADRKDFSRIVSDQTYELGHEGNHQVEETNGLDESETQNGVGEELTTEGRVAGNTVEEGGEDETDTDTSTSKTNGGRAHTNVLGNLNHGLSDLGRVGAALDLEGVAGGHADDLGGLLALESLHGGSSAWGEALLGLWEFNWVLVILV